MYRLTKLSFDTCLVRGPGSKPGHGGSILGALPTFLLSRCRLFFSERVIARTPFKGRRPRRTSGNPGTIIALPEGKMDFMELDQPHRCIPDFASLIRATGPTPPEQP